MVNPLGTIGIWRGEAGLSPDIARAAEDLGFGAVWIGGSPGGELRPAQDMLDATSSIVVATGVSNIWKDEAADLAVAYLRIEAVHPGRFLLGFGTGHPESVGKDYAHPYAALVKYLDDLDEAGVPVGGRALAALGDKVLHLAADRTAAAHPYLTNPEHTRHARELLGPEAVLAPEQKVILDTDVERARALARRRVPDPYFGLVNYTNNLRRLGYSDADFADGGSDRIIDDLVIHGDAATVARGITAHLDAGADHVAVQLLTAPGEDLIAGYRALADALELS